jgi:hypothetical protein
MHPVQHALDPLPIWVLFLLFLGAGLLCYEGGVRIGLWWQRRTPDEKEGPTGIIVGALLALMAFLLGVTVSMAADRYDARRKLVVEEANSIGTTYLRAGYLVQPQNDTIREILRDYVPLRISTRDDEELLRRHAESEQLTVFLWAEAEELARETPSPTRSLPSSNRSTRPSTCDRRASSRTYRPVSRKQSSSCFSLARRSRSGWSVTTPG